MRPTSLIVVLALLLLAFGPRSNLTSQHTAVGKRDSAGRLEVISSDAPTSPTNTYVTDASIAIAATDNLDTGELGAVKLAGFEVTATTSFRAALYTINNGSASANPVAVCGGLAYQTCFLASPHRDYWQVAASAGVDGFRLAVTNTDVFNVASAYAVFHTEQ